MVGAVTYNDMVGHGQCGEIEVTEKKNERGKKGGWQEMRVEASKRGRQRVKRREGGGDGEREDSGDEMSKGRIL